MFPHRKRSGSRSSCLTYSRVSRLRMTRNAMKRPDIVGFIDQNIRKNEKGDPWGLVKHQRAVLGAMYKHDYSTRLYSEIKKSGKTFIAGCVLIYEAVTHAGIECLAVANDIEQAQSRVFQTAVDLCQKNPGLAASVVKVTNNEIRFSNGSVISAIASQYRGAAAGRCHGASLDQGGSVSLDHAGRVSDKL